MNNQTFHKHILLTLQETRKNRNVLSTISQHLEKYKQVADGR